MRLYNTELMRKLSYQSNGSWSNRVQKYRSLRGALVALMLSGVFASLNGCGLSGGGIPPGPIGSSTTGGIPFTRSIVVKGQVQSALPPYAPVSAATVSIESVDGATLAGPVPALSNGSFTFSNLPTNSLVLRIKPQDSTLTQLALALPYRGEDLVQVVAAPLPPGASPASAMTVSATSLSPSQYQKANVSAQLSGASSPQLAPSWIAYGDAGFLSAAGPVAQFDAQAPGAELIVAISGPLASPLTITVPQPSVTSTTGTSTNGTPTTTSGSANATTTGSTNATASTGNVGSLTAGSPTSTGTTASGTTTTTGSSTQGAITGSVTSGATGVSTAGGTAGSGGSSTGGATGAATSATGSTGTTSSGTSGSTSSNTSATTGSTGTPSSGTTGSTATTGSNGGGTSASSTGGSSAGASSGSGSTGAATSGAPAPVVDHLDVIPPSATINVGQSLQLLVIFRDAAGNSISPTSFHLVWATGDVNVATVDSSGKVIPQLTGGTTQITVTDTISGKSAVSVITVVTTGSAVGTIQ